VDCKVPAHMVKIVHFCRVRQSFAFASPVDPETFWVVFGEASKDVLIKQDTCHVSSTDLPVSR
jgi:hypothetical protein